VTPRQTTEQVRDRILEAAGKRFREFGYDKTTCAEIAEDCGMSAANLYRYFENKYAIGAAWVGRYFAAKESVLRRVVDRQDLDASGRIEAFVLENLRLTHSQWLSAPRANDLIEDVSRRRLDVVGRHMKARRTLLVGIIEQGNFSGEFDVPNPTRTADALLSATLLFDHPIYMGLFPLPVFEGKARDVCRVLLQGLRRPRK